METTASDADIGDSIHDTATLSGGIVPTGTITFSLYGPDDPGCLTEIESSQATVIGGMATSPEFTPSLAGEYRWVASYGGDGLLNEPVSGSCNDAGETSTVHKATPTLTTSTTDATVGDPIHDTATITDAYDPSGTVTFELFGPDDEDCNGTPVFTTDPAIAVSGGTAVSDFTPLVAGTYRWRATYSGDANNSGVGSECNADNETSTIAKASPSITTSATDATVGDPIHDTATITDAHDPSGTVTFELFGPADENCTGTPVFTTDPAIAVSGGTAVSDFTPLVAGTYRWRATYNGDDNNMQVIGECGGDYETSTIAKATPTITTSATSATIGDPIHDTATIIDGYNPSGTVTFELFGPADENCTGTPVTIDVAVAVPGGTADSGNLSPSTAGIYSWKATYKGDNNNLQVIGECGGENETSTISKFSPTLTTAATGADLGGTIHDGATLSGGSNPSGTMTFKLYGPDDLNCSGPAVSTGLLARTVAGNHTYDSGNFTPTAPGAYRWTAAYSGDAKNSPIDSGCNAPGETSIVRAKPTLGTDATNATVGDPIHNTATLADAHDPGGTITFRAYGPNNSDCSGQALLDRTVGVADDGSASSGDFTTSASGTYRWKVSYSGDSGNVAIPASCTSDTSGVSTAHPTLATFANDATIGGHVHAIAIITDGYRPGGTITLRAYGPANTDCTGTVAFSSGPIEVSGNGFYGSGDFSPPTTGTYRWTASYSGDNENVPSSTPCNSANGTSTVALNDVRPADQDFDGIPDSIDDCPTVAGAGKTNGCMAIDRALSLKYRRHAFRGTLSPPNACGTEEKVTVLAKLHGQTRKVGGARTNSRGRFVIRAARRKGSYYARALSSLEPTVGLCLATQSKRILSR